MTDDTETETSGEWDNWSEEDIALGKADRKTAVECPKCHGAMFKKE